MIFVNIGSENDATEPFYELIFTHNWQDYNGRSSVKFKILLLFENDVLKYHFSQEPIKGRGPPERLIISKRLKGSSNHVAASLARLANLFFYHRWQQSNV